MTQLDLIFDKFNATATDPVCQMTVSKATPAGATLVYEGKTYYFCCSGCNELFAAGPLQYLESTDDSESRHP